MENYTQIPNDVKTLYPFCTKTIDVEVNGKRIKQSYVDEGNENHPAIILVHGNPTWSFFYRNLIHSLKNRYRVIAPDHIGCGLSDKPEDFSYRLSDHISNLENLVHHLGLKKFHLVLHDWGGAIGTGVAVRNLDKVLSITYMNTAAFTSKTIPWTIDLLRKNTWGEWFIRSFNAFALPATKMAVLKPLKKDIRQGYLYPYNNYSSRIATAKFVKDIPLNENHPSYLTLKAIEDKLVLIRQKNIPINLVWGEKDFCFTMEFFHKFKMHFPYADTTVLKNAGHYLIEDEPEKTIMAVNDFLTGIRQ